MVAALDLTAPAAEPGGRDRRYRGLVTSWRNFLTASASPPEPGATAAADDPCPAAARPIVEVAGVEIRRAYRAVVRAGRAIAADSPATELHELRKDAKKLRYLIESFQSVFPPEAVERMSSVLKELQDNLGTINDLDVQSAALGGFATAMLEEGASPATLLAMGVLIGHLEEQSREARARFADCFARFARTKNDRFVASAFGDATLEPAT
jgi:CHAD domain-containing protein